ncbi:MAG: aldo/keto reductase, partial [Betaproteobacteria bacterium]|nr:aldo/keto reductase [Betaproteobacteria bacterium]
MNYRRLGKTDLQVSEISLGCWTLGGKNWVEGQMNGWADVDEDQVTQALKLAIDRGVNHFDNADVYGNGRAERMLARCLKKLGLRSEDYLIATKVGHFRGTAEHAYDPIHIRHQLEQSLRNLQRDYVDIYYLQPRRIFSGQFRWSGQLSSNPSATFFVRSSSVRKEKWVVCSRNMAFHLSPSALCIRESSWTSTMQKTLRFLSPGISAARIPSSGLATWNGSAP